MAPPKASQEDFNILLHAANDLVKKVGDLGENQRSVITMDQLTKAMEPIKRALNELIKWKGDENDWPMMNGSKENLLEVDQHDERATNPDSRRLNKIEVPEFDGELGPDAIQDWIVHVESVFTREDMTYKMHDAHKVSLVATQFRGQAAIWWNKVQGQQCKQDLEPVTTWARMKKLLKAKFLPLNYRRDLFERLLSLNQESRTIREYTEDFCTLATRGELAENDEIITRAYLLGLREDIRSELYFQYFETVAEAYQHALEAEEIVRCSCTGH